MSTATIPGGIRTALEQAHRPTVDVEALFESTTASLGYSGPGVDQARRLVAQRVKALADLDADAKLTDAYKQQLRGEMDEGFALALAALRESDTAAAVKALDQQEGAARAELLPPKALTADSHASAVDKATIQLANATAKAERRELLASLIEDIEDADVSQMEHAVADVTAYGDPLMSARALRTAIKKLAPDAIRLRREGGPIVELHARLQRQLRELRAAHPSAAARLRAVENERAGSKRTAETYYNFHLPRITGLPIDRKFTDAVDFYNTVKLA